MSDSAKDLKQKALLVESEWIDEAERRYKEYREGKLKARPSDEALRSARNHIK